MLHNPRYPLREGPPRRAFRFPARKIDCHHSGLSTALATSSPQSAPRPGGLERSQAAKALANAATIESPRAL